MPTILTNKQADEMFRHIGGTHPKFKVWLEQELQTNYRTLVSALEIDQVRRAQGSAQLIQKILSKLPQ